MRSIHKLNRWIALLLLAATGFAQASIALAGCDMERRALSRLAAHPAETDDGCERQSLGRVALSTNRCLAHCTADLQIAGAPAAIVRSAGELPFWHLPRRTPQALIYARQEASPPGAIPIRILLHAFLV